MLARPQLRADAHLFDRLSTMPVRIDTPRLRPRKRGEAIDRPYQRRTRDRRTREALTIVEWSGGT